MLWSALAWFGLILLAVVILLLVLPIRVLATWQSEPVQKGAVQLRLFGGLWPRVKVYDSTRQKTRKTEKPSRKRKNTKPKRSFSMAVRRVGWSDIRVLLQRLLRAIHIETLRLDAEFGLGDPAETGQMFGQLTPLIYGTGADLQLRPNFAEACLRGDAFFQFRFSIFGLVWPLVRFAWRLMGPGR